MDALLRKKLRVISKYAEENFTVGDWYSLGNLTGQLDYVESHSRLLRSMRFVDEDYGYCISEVITHIAEQDPEVVHEIVDHFDIDLWYEAKNPEKYRRLFGGRSGIVPEFWIDGYLKAFVSHRTRSLAKVAQLKLALARLGVSAFLAHEDIEASREWQRELLAALESMDVMLVFIEPEFEKSKWTDQEIGFALGRRVDVIPICVGQDPHGFIEKIQGVKGRGKLPNEVADALLRILARKPNLRGKLLRGLKMALTSTNSNEKVLRIANLDSLKVFGDEDMRELLEGSALLQIERNALAKIIETVGAFSTSEFESTESDDVPF